VAPAIQLKLARNPQQLAALLVGHLNHGRATQRAAWKRIQSMMMLTSPHLELGHRESQRARQRFTIGISPFYVVGAFLLWVVFCAVTAVGSPQESIPPRFQSARTMGAVPASDSKLSDAYRISPDDLVDIYVVDVPEYSRSYRIGPDGTLRLPLLDDPIMAAGLTPALLGDVIGKTLASRNLLHDPDILVEVKESRSHAIAIAGAVKLPQNLQVFSSMRVLSAISQAGGLAEDASDTAVITRGEISTRILGPNQVSGISSQLSTEGTRTASIDLRRLLEGSEAENLELYPGDSVTVERAGVVYVVGAVNRAGGFVMDGQHGNITVLKAIALAENLKPTAASKKAFIIRKNSAFSNGSNEIPINLNNILSKHAPDTPLVAGDVLFVPDSNARKALYRAGEAAWQAATMISYGLVIYRP
jgi:polysaccharide biosynthesis/export protein